MELIDHAKVLVARHEYSAAPITQAGCCIALDLCLIEMADGKVGTLNDDPINTGTLLGE